MSSEPPEYVGVLAYHSAAEVGDAFLTRLTRVFGAPNLNLKILVIFFSVHGDSGSSHKNWSLPRLLLFEFTVCIIFSHISMLNS